MKKCFKCNEEKDFSEFYRHGKMSDGYLGKCKDCTRADVKSNRDRNIEYYRQYDSWRFKNDPRVKERLKSYRDTEKFKESVSKSMRRYADENPDKRSAHRILNNAIRCGRVVKPDRCEICGSFTPSRKLHGHHDDYSLPLAVRWMCASCHTKEHKFCKLREDFQPKRAKP